MLGVMLTLLTVLAATLFWMIRKNKSYWRDRGFPDDSLAVPMKSTKKSEGRAALINMTQRAYVNNPDKKYVGFWMLMKPTLLLRDLDVIKSILVRDFDTFHDRGIYYNEKADPISGHLIALRGEKWKNTRVKITPAFSSGKMKNMFPLISHVGEKLAKIISEKVEKKEQADIQNILQRYTTDVVALTSFGLESSSLEDPNATFHQFGKRVLQPNFIDRLRGSINLLMPSLSKALNFPVFSKDVTDYYVSAIMKTIEYREKNNITRNDLVDILIQLRKSGQIDDAGKEHKGDGKKFSDSDIAAQSFIFFAAGFETSSTAMTFALYELATHPEIQKKVREEIRMVLNKHDNVITYDAVNEMTYLSNVFDETLRLYPVARMLSRISSKDYKIPGTSHVIPKGMRVVINAFAIHRDPSIYPDPEKFDPDRFSEEQKQNRHSCAYLPFGEGPRFCIGMRFGLLQSKAGLVHLLSKFQFDATDKTPIPMVFNPNATLLKPKDPLYLKITPIETE